MLLSEHCQSCAPKMEASASFETLLPTYQYERRHVTECVDTLRFPLPRMGFICHFVTVILPFSSSIERVIFQAQRFVAQRTKKCRCGCTSISIKFRI